MFEDEIPLINYSPPVISSPLRKIQRSGIRTDNSFGDIGPVHNYAGFDVIFNLTPNEILSIQEDEADYICGVETNGKVCRKSFFCSHHSLEQRKGVKRSLSLECLITEESKNVAWFRKRRMLTKLYHDCKSYWQKHISASMTPMTCSRTSCLKEDSYLSSSPRCVSLTSHNASRVIVSNEEGTFSSLKTAFLKKLSRSADAYKDDIVSTYSTNLLVMKSPELILELES
ncbi:hypothetical protein JCM33374_g1708 [Metschnikowia sp. JCM 33374]|nr:hypothetical protein JCM33374_g1708 [Metschnikowia sp. JCM 33374]